jgi:hypothetical protein
MSKFHKSFGDCEGPLGFPMKSAVARELEATLKSLDADCKAMLDAAGGIVRRAAPAKVEADAAEHSDVALVTTDAIDLDREVLVPEGADWEPFRKNGGPVTYAHNYKVPTVGHCAWIVPTQNPNGWKAKTIYHSRPGKDVLPKEAPWFPDVAFHFVKELGMSGRSIGFVPRAVHKPTPAEIAARPELKNAKKIIAKWAGYEYAVTPIPCNLEATVEMVSKAMKHGFAAPRQLLDALRIVMPGAEGDEAEPEPEAPPEEAITVPELKAMLSRKLQGLDIPAILAEAIDRLRGRV